MSADMLVNECVERRSLKEEAWNEACLEKYLRSKEAGRDLGESVIRHWVHRHWPGFLRARWIEHMQGVRFWIELDRDEFGLLKRTSVDMRPILDRIIQKLMCGAENLDIICWSRSQRPDEQEAIRKILKLINVNAHRLRCLFLDDDYHTTPAAN